MGGSLIKRANKRQRRIGRRARESTIRTVRNQMPAINLKNCFITNKKLHCKWEEKIGKKFVLHQEPNKKSGSKSRKKEFSSDLDNDDACSNLDNGNTYTFIKKELGYFYAHLNRKN